MEANNEQFEVTLPLMGEGVHEATLVRWLKSSGDTVAKDEPLVEVSTDKVDTEIPAPVGGVLVSVVAKEGDTIAVNGLLGIIASGPAGTTFSGDAARQTRIPPPPSTSASQSSDREPATTPGQNPPARAAMRSSPLVRKLAREHNLTLELVKGSGLHGRITRRDLEAFLQSRSSHKTLAPEPKKSKASTDQGDLLDGVPVRREPMSKMRRLIADHMVESVRTSPHVTTVFEINMHAVTTARDKVKTEFQRKESFSLTFTPYLIRAAVLAIQENPIVNVSVDGYDILYKDKINMGCAVAIESGLIVPVISDAGELSVTEIARRLNDLASRARTKKLLPEEVRGGTFTITNPGSFGSLTSNPIINQPQVAILGIGCIRKLPVVIDDMIAIRPMMLASLTFDHRVVDGDGGAKFLSSFKRILESTDGGPLAV